MIATNDQERMRDALIAQPDVVRLAAFPHPATDRRYTGGDGIYLVELFNTDRPAPPRSIHRLYPDGTLVPSIASIRIEGA